MDILYKENEDSLRQSFLDVLNGKKIRTVFQPIVNLRDGSIYGYEALSRGPCGSVMESPDFLFECAERFGMVWDLELLCRISAIEAVFRMSRQFKLFLNVNPNIMHDAKFQQGFTKDYLERYNISPENIVFEISEKGSVNNVADFIRTIDNYKRQNYKIAIDDTGAGYSGLNLISDIHPHFIKLDMNLIRDIDKDVVKQALVKGIAEFASLTNTFLIAEGIETRNELLKLIDIGVNFGQGYYLQKPEPCSAPLKEKVVNTIKDANSKKNHLLDKRTADLYVSNISTPQKSITPKILVEQVYELMEKNSSLSGICITEDERLVGIITRSELYKYLSGRYGFTLFAKKPIEKIMRRDFLKVDFHESIAAVAKKAMSRDFEHLYDFIAVTEGENYYGIVTVKDLLEKAMQVEVSNAKYINPLSELPGNILIEKKLQECIDLKSECSFLYFDIDNFKAYNDVYGFENGDRVIKDFVKILKKNILEERDFIGHIGGDDFVAIIYGNSLEDLCRRIVTDFDASVIRYYSTNDYKNGYITTKNRHGIDEDFPLLSISIVGIHNSGYKTTYKMSEKIAALKKVCKQKPGSNYIIG